MVIGRESICWNCGDTFRMNLNSLLLKPHCGCKTKAKEIDNTKNELLKSLMERINS